jgi:hypothetical protein
MQAIGYAGPWSWRATPGILCSREEPENIRGWAEVLDTYVLIVDYLDFAVVFYLDVWVRKSWLQTTENHLKTVAETADTDGDTKEFAMSDPRSPVILSAPNRNFRVHEHFSSTTFRPDDDVAPDTAGVLGEGQEPDIVWVLALFCLAAPVFEYSL